VLSSRVLRRSFFAVAVLAASATAFASSRLIAPMWDVYVVDEAGKPVAGIAVTETHQDLTCEHKNHSETQFTDGQGHVLFHERYFMGNSAMCGVKITAKTVTLSHRKGRHASIVVGDSKSALYGLNLDRNNKVIEWVDKPDRMKSKIVAHPRKPGENEIPAK
jgi:hypothetical protein